MNAALAVAAARRLRERGFAIGDDAIASGLDRARLPGRVELMPSDAPSRVMLDGAHNPQKIGALVADLDAILPRRTAGRRIGVIGVLEAKDFKGLVGPLVPAIDELVATSPQVLSKAPLDVQSLAAAARAAGFHGPVTLEPDPRAAIDVALSRAIGEDDAVLVTGSLYLVGNVRGRWYPEEAILRARTPWPARAPDTPQGTSVP
jgi:dihydrofolate synthase/folylpolyglutamate synthase